MFIVSRFLWGTRPGRINELGPLLQGRSQGCAEGVDQDQGHISTEEESVSELTRLLAKFNSF